MKARPGVLGIMRSSMAFPSTRGARCARSLSLALLVVALLAGESYFARAGSVPAGRYKLDRTHASLLFRVDHLGFSRYTARFTKFDAILDFDPKRLADSRVEVTVDATSIETDFPNPLQVDFNQELQKTPWLDAERHPRMTFRSLRVVPQANGGFRIDGELTLRGVTQPIVLEGRYNGGYEGLAKLDPNARIGFSARGALKRSAFGMTVGIPAPGTTMGVGDEVEVLIEAEFSGPPLPAATDKQ